MYEDTRTLHRQGGWEVLAQQQHVGWHDGSALAMHPLRLNGVDDMWRRAIVLDSGCVVIFDLRHVCPAIKREFHLQPARDRQGFALMSLRMEFTSAHQVLELAQERAESSWWPDEGPPTWDAWQQAELGADLREVA